MRKHLLYFLPLLLCIIHQNKVQAQVALTAGVHSANVTPDYFATDAPSTEKPRTGVHVGIISNLPFSNKSMFSFQPGILYHERGSSSQTTFENNQVSRKEANQKLNYIDIPLNIVAKLPLSKKVKALAGVGPQASIFYNGSVTTSTYFSDGSFVVSENKDLPVGSGDGKYTTLHPAAYALAGIEVGRIIVTARYNRSLAPFFEKDNITYKHQSVGASLSVLLGKQEKAEPKIKDTDKDGVPDREDACPSKAGTAITKGCPDKDGDGIRDEEDHCPDVAGALKDSGCPLYDRDNDGVMDNEDPCPNMAGPVKYKGCPVPDTDGDGINDEMDKCLTVAGARENNGCPVIQTQRPVFNQEAVKIVSYAARKIRFNFQKATLLPGSYPVLDDVVTLLKKHSNFNIIIEGHTTGEGHEDANKKLSYDRADAVKNYLIAKGITAQRITVLGYGSSRPVTNSKVPAEMAKNRRVELRLTN